MLDEEAAKMLQAEFDEEERLAREKTEKEEEEANIALIENGMISKQRLIEKKKALCSKKSRREKEQITNTSSTEKDHVIFSQMLKSFNKEDLEDLYKLVKAKYKSTRPVEDLDLLLWGDLKTMFEPHVEDKVWRNQQQYKVLNWKLYDSCGVHSLMMQHVQIYMLVEKKYPLAPLTLSMMLENKLMIEYESEMAYQLLKFIIKQLKK
ncbi:hypothetical protein Tco_0733964 [Tanacetum coccineum]